MQSLDEFIPEGRTIILVGPAGCGKTTLATRFPNPYLIIADPNALAGPMKVAKKESRPIGHVKYDFLHRDETGKEILLGARFDRMSKLFKEAANNPLVGTIILDSTTSLVPVFKAKVNLVNGKAADALLEGWNQWGQFESLWMQFLDWMLTSTKINIIISHEQVDKDEMDKVLRYALAIPGKSAETLPRIVSDVWQMSVDTKVEGNPPALRSKHLVTTVQNNLRPNIKSSLDIPNQFEATQEMVDKIVAQIIPPK